MTSKISVIALVAGIATLLLIAVSVFVPWWQFKVGTPALAVMDFSPVNFNVNLFGVAFNVPLIWAMNVATLLTLAAGAIVLLVYAVKPTKPYSKKLLSFGYNKPIYAVVLFVAELLVLTYGVGGAVGFAIPLIGSKAMALPPSLAPNGANISVNVSAGFLWPFYFAIVVVALCVATRLYHRKIADVATPGVPLKIQAQQ